MNRVEQERAFAKRKARHEEVKRAPDGTLFDCPFDSPHGGNCECLGSGLFTKLELMRHLEMELEILDK